MRTTSPKRQNCNRRWKPGLSNGGHGDKHNLVKMNVPAWLLIYLSIATLLSLVLPFLMALAVLVIVVLSLNIFITEITLRKSGIGGIKGWYKSLVSSELGHRWDTRRNSYTYNRLKFYCMNCGYEHRKISCPKCGSKAVKAA